MCSLSYLEALLGLIGTPGTAYGVVYSGDPDRCPVKDLSTGPCVGCPTEDREEIGFADVLDVDMLCAIFERTVDHIGTTVVADDALSIASWQKTQELATWHGERSRPFGVVTSGDRIVDLMDELMACTGLCKIGVSIDAPRDQQDSLRSEAVFDRTVEGLKHASKTGLMSRIEIVQVLRKARMDWLIKLLPVLAEAGVSQVSVSAFVDFANADDRPIQDRILDLRLRYQGLLRYTSKARQLGIEVKIDDLMHVLPLDQGLKVRRQSPETHIFRIATSGSIEGFWTALGKHDPAVMISHPDQIHQARKEAFERSDWLSPL